VKLQNTKDQEKLLKTTFVLLNLLFLWWWWWQNSHDIKFTILMIFKLNSIKCVLFFSYRPPDLFSSSQTETPYPLNNSHFPLAAALGNHHSTLFMSWTATYSRLWNHPLPCSPMLQHVAECLFKAE
jgi:hypothetical protein